MNGRPFGSGLRRTAQTAAGKSAFRRFFAVSELFFTVFELFFHNRHAAFSPPRLREYTLPSPEFAEERVAHHPEPRKGSLLEYCLCVIPSAAEGSEPNALKVICSQSATQTAYG